MRYHVYIPFGKPLQFPELCPFTGKPAANKFIRLSKVKNGFVLPVPGVGIYNRYSESTIDLPASENTARMHFMMRLAPVGLILLTLGVAGFLASTDGAERSSFLVFVLGLPLAFLVAMFRWWHFRQVRVIDSSESHLEVAFTSQDYARQLSELNRLGMTEW